MTGFVIEIVDSKTGHISVYPEGAWDTWAMTTQIDWQRRYHPDYRWSYRLRYRVDPDDQLIHATPTDMMLDVTTIA